MREERTNRQLAELLQEFRVALPGRADPVRVPAHGAVRAGLPAGSRRSRENLFFATLMCTAISTACLIAPTATHRLRFHKRDRKYVIEVAHNLLIAGLAFLALAILGAVTLITDYLFDGAARWIWPGIIAVVIAGLWFIRPLLRSDSSGP